MKKNTKKILILGLVIPFFIAALFCCCLAQPAHASRPTASCHETDHASQPSSDHTKECDCKENLITVTKYQFSGLPLFQFSLENIAMISHAPDSTAVFPLAYQSPPAVFFDTQPLYIKHSILRI